MIQIRNDSSTLVLVIHEIYGINQHMHNFCKLLSDYSLDVICPNLLERDTPFDYSQEEAAYRNFMENLGFAHAAQKIKDILSDSKDKYDKIFIIGFSVGATVAWLCSEEDCVSGVVGYYGSRIRNYLELTPQCPAILFFPQKEQSFNVDDLISTLDKKTIEIRKFNGKHGFSDPYSPNYNVRSAQEAFNKMVIFIS